MNQSLEKQWIGTGGNFPISMAELSISPNDWFAVDKRSGEPVQVEMTLNDSIIKTIPSHNPNFPARNLLLEKPANSAPNFAFSIRALIGNDSLLLGGIDQSELSRNKLFQSFGDNENYLFTSDNLPPNKRNVSIAPELPFLLSTGEYSQNLTRFTLMDRETRKPLVPESYIRLRGGKIFEVKERVFLVLITQVDHTAQRKRDEPYAKFGVIELNPS